MDQILQILLKEEKKQSYINGLFTGFIITIVIVLATVFIIYLL